MQYRIVAIQTIFGEERERRLKRVFDIILSLGARKPGAENGRSNRKNQKPELSLNRLMKLERIKRG